MVGLLALIVHEESRERAAVPSATMVDRNLSSPGLAYLIPYKAAAFNTRFFLRALSAKDRLESRRGPVCQAIDTSG